MRMRRICSLILCMLLVLMLPMQALAEETQLPAAQLIISDEARFLQFAEKCRLDSYSAGLVVSLRADLDLSGTDFQGIPIFCGRFEGNGHTISGLAITGAGSVQGLFRYVAEGAQVCDLNVSAQVQPGGSANCVGGIAGSNAGSIVNCTFSGTVSGADEIGGLVGENTVTGVIEDCMVKGSIYGNHFVGGVAGSNQGVIRSCTNRAEVNITSQQNRVSISDITMETLTNSESANTVTDVGGIAGSNQGVIRGCINRGDVGYKHMGYNIGGIAGSQMGYIQNCENRGAVSGRKEVGGIVGQMEPTALIEYTQDALQILQEQLDELGQTVGQAAANAQASATEVIAQTDALQFYIENARLAVEQLLPSEEDPALPDADSILAAQNVLSNSFAGMTQTLQGMEATAQSAVGTLNNNLSALQRQIDQMRTTLGNVSETVGGSIEDVSDQDTDGDLTGKVADCVNYGSVLADLNAGGIAGAMALENDLDQEEDIAISGENSLNFESRLRVVIVNCENRAAVTVKKQNGGGITGWMQFGLVKDCRNTGSLEADGAEYIGGIAGQSDSYIRNSGAKCRITGAVYVGGIAGDGTVVTGCRSMVRLSGTEKLGAVLGYTEDREGEDPDEEAPIAENYYLVVDRDLGGIDGISYAGLAQSMPEEAFWALEDLPSIFDSVTIRFVYEDGGTRTVVLAPGAALEQERVPKLPEKEGYTAAWEGLEDLDTSFDAVIKAVYTPFASTIQSQLARDGRPVVLAEGTFLPGSQVIAEEGEQVPGLASGQTLLDVISLRIEQAPETVTVRYLLPEDREEENLKLLVCTDGTIWEEKTFAVDGSYLVFNLTGERAQAALVQETPVPWLLIACVGAGLALLPACCAAVRRKKRVNATASEENR